MPLSMELAFTNADICSCKMLKRGKVFLLMGLQGEQLVVKNENPGPGQTAAIFKPSNTVMKVVDPRVKVKPLQNNEISALQTFATEAQNNLRNLSGVVKAELDNGIREAVACLSEVTLKPVTGNIWIKMRLQEVQDLEHAVARAIEVHRGSALEPFINALSNKGGMEKLGEIVAADAFIGNTDRFVPFGSKIGSVSVLSGGKLYPFAARTLCNIGNVFIGLNEAGKLAPSPLDFLDPNGPFQRFGRLADTEMERGKPWPGRVLVTKELRLRYARNIVADLENLLTLGKPSFFWTKLGRNSADRLEAGMAAAKDRIQARLLQKMDGRVPNFPEAMLDRCRALSGLDPAPGNIAAMMAATI
jgi:hypothetical protein